MFPEADRRLSDSENRSGSTTSERDRYIFYLDSDDLDFNNKFSKLAFTHERDVKL